MALPKKFVAQATTQILLSTKASQVFRGHKLKKFVLDEIKARPDIARYFAVYLSKMRSAKKGIMGLARAKNFHIYSYKNYAEFVKNAPIDMTDFASGLTPEDAATFTKDTPVVIAFVPEHYKTKFDLDFETDVLVPVKGRSVQLPYEKAMNRKNMVAGTRYIMILAGQSAIRPDEVKVAYRTDKKNGLLVARLEKKTKKRLTTEQKELKQVRKEIGNLTNDYNNLKNLASQQKLMRGLYGDDIVGGVAADNLSADAYTASMNDFLRSVPYDELKVYQRAKKLYAMGDKKRAIKLVAGMPNSETFITLLNSGDSGYSQTEKRYAQLQQQVRKLQIEKAGYIDSLAVATAPNQIASINRKIASLTRRIGQVRASMKYYANGREVLGDNNYEAMLAQVSQKLDAARARGVELRTAIRSTIQQLPVEQSVKQQIAQQAMQNIRQQVAQQSAVDATLAVQDAIETQLQQMPSAQQLGDYDFDDLFAKLG